MITGIGTDIVEIERVRGAMERRRGFASRVFTQAERDYCGTGANSFERYAGRFAAKEAVAKALGVSLSWLDVEILPNAVGKPEVRLHNHAADVAGERRVMVSVSHSKLYAVANAIAVEE